MAICVYSDMNGASNKVTDKELLKILERLKEETGRHWELEESVRVTKKFLHKPVNLKVYSLYLDCHGEWQVINFCPAKEGGYSINTTVDRAAIGNYITGYLGGIWDMKARNEGGLNAAG